MSRDQKTDSLRRDGALNARPEQVTDELFSKNEFFDARDLVQVKYEMLRRVREDNHTVSESAARFGVSRATWYGAARAFDAGGLAALARQKPGPRARHKLTDEVVGALRKARTDNPRVSIRDLKTMLEQRFGVQLHRRTIERFFNEPHVEKKLRTKYHAR